MLHRSGPSARPEQTCRRPLMHDVSELGTSSPHNTGLIMPPGTPARYSRPPRYLAASSRGMTSRSSRAARRRGGPPRRDTAIRLYRQPAARASPTRACRPERADPENSPLAVAGQDGAGVRDQVGRPVSGRPGGMADPPVWVISSLTVPESSARRTVCRQSFAGASRTTPWLLGSSRPVRACCARPAACTTPHCPRSTCAGSKTRRSGHGLAVGPAGFTACPPGASTCCSSRDGVARVTGPGHQGSGAGGCAIVRSR